MSGHPSVLVLDVDGTLVDSVYLHTICWWQAFHQHGFEVPMVDIHRSVGMGADHLVPHLLGPMSATYASVVTDEHRRLWHLWWARTRPTPGAGLLLREARRMDLTVVLASSAAADELAAMRDVVGCEDCITAAVGASDVSSSKPDPDVLAAALERVGAQPEDALFVGDSLWDAAAARRVGVTFLGVTTGGVSELELLGAGAAAVYTDPGELAMWLSTWVGYGPAFVAQAGGRTPA